MKMMKMITAQILRIEKQFDYSKSYFFITIIFFQLQLKFYLGLYIFRKEIIYIRY